MIEGELECLDKKDKLLLWKISLRGENNKVIKWGGANETENPENRKRMYFQLFQAWQILYSSWTYFSLLKHDLNVFYSYFYCSHDYRFAIIKRGEIVGLLETLVFFKSPHYLSWIAQDVLSFLKWQPKSSYLSKSSVIIFHLTNTNSLMSFRWSDQGFWRRTPLARCQGRPSVSPGSTLR